MKIYIYLDNHDLAELAPVLSERIQNWLTETNINAQLINRKDEERISELDPEFDHWDFGIEFFAARNSKLKSPLNFLYTLAKEFEQEFVLGTMDEETGEQQAICYFGNTEGKPDMFEISNYLGL